MHHPLLSPCVGAKMRTLLAQANQFPKINVAVVYPESRESLGGAILAARVGYITPYLIGNREKLFSIAKDLYEDISNYPLIEANENNATEKAIELVQQGKVDVIMKGSLHSQDLMHDIVRHGSELRTTQRMSNVMIIDTPNYHKLLFLTDGGINISPDVEEKKLIVKNAIYLAKAFGVNKPKVALLAAIEKVNPKIPATVDAGKINEWAKENISDAYVDGPIAFDLAISQDAANCKHYVSEVAGDADILVAPDLNSCNILFKALNYMASGVLVGLVVGAKVPIIFTSRSTSAKERALSCQLTKFYLNYLKQNPYI